MDIAIPSRKWLKFDTKAWQGLGKKLATQKQDDPTKIGILLERFAEGMHFVFDNSNVPTLLVPALIIDTDLPARTRGAEFHREENAIVLSALHVWGKAARTLTEIIECKHDDAAMLFRGTTSEYFRLLGVEEADHADFVSRYGPQPISDDSIRSTARYDASPIEFRSLETRLRATDYFRMPEHTQKVLNLRIENAKRIAAITGRDSQQ